MGVATLMSVAMAFLYYLTVIGAILLVLGWVRARFPRVGLLGMLLLSMLLSPFVGTLVRHLPWWALLITGPIGAWQTLQWVRRLLGLRPPRHIQGSTHRRPVFRVALGVVRAAVRSLAGSFRRHGPQARPAATVRPVPRTPRPAVRPKPLRTPRPREALPGRRGPWPDPM